MVACPGGPQSWERLSLGQVVRVRAGQGPSLLCTRAQSLQPSLLWAGHHSSELCGGHGAVRPEGGRQD